MSYAGFLLLVKPCNFLPISIRIVPKFPDFITIYAII